MSSDQVFGLTTGGQILPQYMLKRTEGKTPNPTIARLVD